MKERQRREPFRHQFWLWVELTMTMRSTLLVERRPCNNSCGQAQISGTMVHFNAMLGVNLQKWIQDILRLYLYRGFRKEFAEEKKI